MTEHDFRDAYEDILRRPMTMEETKVAYLAELIFFRNLVGFVDKQYYTLQIEKLPDHDHEGAVEWSIFHVGDLAKGDVRPCCKEIGKTTNFSDALVHAAASFLEIQRAALDKPKENISLAEEVSRFAAAITAEVMESPLSSETKIEILEGAIAFVKLTEGK